MVDDDIFRREALEHHRRPRREGDLLRLSRPWLGVAYWGLCLAVAGGLALLAWVHLDDYVDGAAVIRRDRDGQLVSAVFAGADRSRLRAGQQLDATIAGRRLDLAIGQVGPLDLTTGKVEVTARLAPGASDLHEGLIGTARARVGSRRAIFALLPGLSALSGDGR